MSAVTLRYEPSWHHLGNLDSIPLALAYGTLALGAILLLEYIAAGILFSKANGILISDAAATVTFSHASWIDVGHWAFVNRPSTRICKRAVLAIFLRYFIIAIDILILVVSLPRSIPVYERQVGSSVMGFSDGPLPTNQVAVDAEIFNAPCKPDPIEYEGFKPEASRQLCMSSVVSGTNTSDSPNINFATTDVYVVANFNGNRALTILYMNMGVLFTYSHIMRLDGTQYLLPPRPGIVDEYTNRFLALKGGTCTSQTKRNLQTESLRGTIAVIECPKIAPSAAVGFPPKLFSLMKTRPLKAGEVRNKYKNFNEPVPPGQLFRVGTIDRPRVCIIPAVIMFLSLLVVACIVRITKGKQDLAFKQWSFVSRCYGSENVDNPLYSDCSEFERWNTDGSMASFHQSNYTQDVKSAE